LALKTIDRRRRDGVGRRDSLRVAARCVAKRIRPWLDNFIDAAQHPRFAERTCHRDRRAESYQHANVRRIIDLHAAAAGRRR
jgi:hypothetical protein